WDSEKEACGKCKCDGKDKVQMREWVDEGRGSAGVEGLQVMEVAGKVEEKGVQFDETSFPYGSMTYHASPPYTFLDPLPNIVAPHFVPQLQQMVPLVDVKNAFLYGSLYETIYMHKTPDFRDPGEFSDLGPLNCFLGICVARSLAVRDDRGGRGGDINGSGVVTVAAAEGWRWWGCGSAGDRMVWPEISPNPDDSMKDATRVFFIHKAFALAVLFPIKASKSPPSFGTSSLLHGPIHKLSQKPIDRDDPCLKEKNKSGPKKDYMWFSENDFNIDCLGQETSHLKRNYLLRISQWSLNNSKDDVPRILQKVMLCLLVGTLIWLLKTIIVKLLAASFHLISFFRRIRVSLYKQYVIKKLGGDLIKGRNQEETSGKLSRHVLGKKRLVAMKVKQMIEIVQAGDLPRLSTVEEDLPVRSDEEDEDEYSLRARNEHVKRERALYKASHRVIRCITIEDLKHCLGEDKLTKAQELFAGSMCKVEITEDGFSHWMMEAHRERRTLALSVNDTKTAVDDLHHIMNVIVYMYLVQPGRQYLSRSYSCS
nr:mechanosensitive ion channel protein 6-like [Tanacetum cinerariifolium]